MGSFCSNCGNKLEEGDYFCRECGASVARTSGDYAAPTTDGQSNATSNDTNGFAVGGFTISIVSLFLCGSFSLIGLILSIVGLTQANKHGGNGKGLAIAGIVISGIIIFMIIALILFVMLVTFNVDSTSGGGNILMALW